MKPVVLVFSCLASVASLSNDEAGASEWGCEVLLCAASSDPSWHAIASCRPPMERLISAMKRPGFSWPTCPEGGAGKPSFEPYADCPAGWTPAPGDRSGNGAGRNELSQCSRVDGGCGGDDSGSVPADGANGIRRVYSGDHSCSYTEFIQRPLRENPYYFDITDRATNTVSRHFFNLRK